jgi:hypothetical protein
LVSARVGDAPTFPPDFGPEDIETCTAVAQFTMTSPERIYALCEAVRYLVRTGITGGIVECGVWRGGSMMAVARTLLQLGQTHYDLYLFDTFEGMTPPGREDSDYAGRHASVLLAAAGRQEHIWGYSSLDETAKAVHSVGYPRDRIHLIRGRVEDTIPGQAPPVISLLRLDTDWYESTLHELIHLFPRLAVGGVIIVDDYGHWKGSREATDQYLRECNVRLLLTRIDYTGRLGVKT